ncbi:hypothetical protein ACLQ28_20975 [Micromonospora sp. DT201]|uniref:hypothetical protein n=1 Tax=Micromonospora sp. DT201 TaxID=3393442 RepID=UPI003CFA04F9
MSGAAVGAEPLRPTRLLRRNRSFRTLFSARVVSYAGDSLGLVALMFHVAETTGQALAISLLLLVGDFAPSLLGPFTGALTDRLNLRRLMVVCELVQAVVLLVIVLALPPLPVLLISGFAVSSVGNLLTGFAWAVAAAIALQAVRGLGLAAMDVASNTLLQRTVPAGMLGRVFGNLYGAIGVAAATSYIAGGLLLDATSAPVTLIVAGVGGLVATGIVALRLPPAMRRADEDGATPTQSGPAIESTRVP